MANINVIVGQKVVLAVVPTKNSLAADLVSTPTWTTTDDTVAGIDPAADGRTCQVTAKKTGSATVTVNAQGAGALSANHTIVVAANNLATALGLTVQSPPTTPQS
ncbi:MAG: hypothetical protein AB7L09_01250 [Nitrospira sp.]